LDDKHAEEPSPLSIDKSNHKIYFHSEKIGHKLDAIANSEKVSFCVCEKECHKDGHWLLNIRSVIIFGRIRIVDDWSDDLSIRRDGYALGSKG
jgi:nitroimidazol reductase NimA-like FMN-containing flavoprotein (pyridoxamine 5'-phosphate oxidase superfamily)